jgi:hypothetical protein
MMTSKGGGLLSVSAMAVAALLVTGCTFRLRGNDEAEDVAPSFMRGSGLVSASPETCDVATSALSNAAPADHSLEERKSNAAHRPGRIDKAGSAARKDEARLPSGYPFAKMQSE